MYKNKSKEKITRHNYYIKNRAKIKRYINMWRKKNPDRVMAQHKKYFTNNKTSSLRRSALRMIRCLKSWEGFIPKRSRCQICNKKIYFNTSNQSNSIHFDHRHGGMEPIKHGPAQWLRSNPRNKYNESIWIKSDFGKLCIRCNQLLPTKNRIKWLERAILYAKSY